ncbi:MAG: glycoside hydrolase family 15 protein, partial [Bacteriovoracaceae bacterium]
MLSISDYGLIGNTRTAALVSREGSIDWCCLPRFDSDGIFSKILDEKGGHMQISPKGSYSSRQQYLPDTNVLETIFTTSTGEVRLLDCFPVDTEDRKKRTLSPFHEILRIVEGVYGEVEMIFAMEPRPDFGKKKIRERDAGKFGTRYDFGSETLYLNHDLGVEGNTFLIMGGEKKIFSLSYNITGPGIIPPLGDQALIRLERTINYWREWIETCTYRGEYSQEVRRSALALKLLTYSPSGAIIAAPTTSLPEKIKGERNWDYRFCWLRDAAFTVRAFLGLGLIEEARAYMSWILHST